MGAIQLYLCARLDGIMRQRFSSTGQAQHKQESRAVARKPSDAAMIQIFVVNSERCIIMVYKWWWARLATLIVA